MQINRNDTAVVFIDPQNEVLSERGAAWASVGESVRENKTVENIERIFQAAKQHRFEVFISIRPILAGNSTGLSRHRSTRTRCWPAAEY